MFKLKEADLHRTGWEDGRRGGEEEERRRDGGESLQDALLSCCCCSWLCVDIQVAAVPAEVQQGACGGGDALSRPAEEVELSESPGLLRLHVLQVEASHQEVVAPDVFRHQVHLDREESISSWWTETNQTCPQSSGGSWGDATGAKKPAPTWLPIKTGLEPALVLTS